MEPRAVVAGGLLVRLGSRWHFAEDGLSDELLVLAASSPLDQPLPDSLHSLFSARDPWRQRPDLASFTAAMGRRRAQTRRDDLATPMQPPAPSVQLDVGTSESAGRGLFAPAVSPAGTVLLRERAFAATLWPCAHETHCHHCLRPILPPAAALRCDQCTKRHRCVERYCSASCRDDAWRSGHAAECGTLLHEVAPRTVLLCLRAFIRGTTLAGHSAGLSSLLDLHDHAREMPPSRLSQLRLHAHVAAHATCGGGSRVGVSHAEETLYRLLRLALTNSFAVSERHGSGSSMSTSGDLATGGTTEAIHLRRIGEALYPCASLLNHACAPNAHVRHIGASIEVRAAKALVPADELCICYGPQAGYAPLEDRRTALRTTHFFVCSCVACTSEAAVGKCAPVGARDRGADEEVVPTGRLHECDALGLRERAQSLDALARAACERGDFEQAAEHSADALALLRRVFPAGSPQIAHEQAKLAMLLFNADDLTDHTRSKATASALRDAATSLAKCEGEEDEEVAELRRLENHLICMGRRRGGPRDHFD